MVWSYIHIIDIWILNKQLNAAQLFKNILHACSFCLNTVRDKVKCNGDLYSNENKQTENQKATDALRELILCREKKSIVQESIAFCAVYFTI